MTEDESEKQDPPPKIKLNGNGTPAPDAPEAVLPSSDEADAPPKVQLGHPASKSPTMKVEIPQAIPSKAKSETTKIELSEADVEGGLNKEPPIDLPHGIPSRAKRDTTRVDVSAADDLGKTQAISKEAAASIPSLKDTSAINDKEEQGIKESLTEAYKEASNATMRIEIDDSLPPPETGKIEDYITPTGAGHTRKSTSVDLSEVLGQPPPAHPSPSPGSKPKTMRIKRGDMTSETGEGASMKLEAPMPIPDSLSGIRKGQTARIELPAAVADAPPTRKKTIRIKRPDGSPGTARPVTVSRSPAMPAQAAASEDAPSALFLVCTILTLIIAGVLVYALAAQVSSINVGDYTSSLPFPGRTI